VPRQDSSIKAVLFAMPPLLLELWREQHPEGHERTNLDFRARQPAAKPSGFWLTAQTSPSKQIQTAEPVAALSPVWHLMRYSGHVDYSVPKANELACGGASLRVSDVQPFWRSSSLSTFWKGRTFMGRVEIEEQLWQRVQETLRDSETRAAAGQFSAAVMHEINNPLEAISNLNYLVQREAADEAKVREYSALLEGELA